MPTNNFCSTINYSSCNEDWRTETLALDINQEDEILCVTGSGDRPMHLLLGLPKKIVAIDGNPVQNHLLHLKITALKTMPFEQYLGFLGLKPQTDRIILFENLAKQLPSESGFYWNKKRSDIADGVIYQGRFERYYRRLAMLAGSLRGTLIEELFSFDSIEKQSQFVRKRWDKLWWRATYLALCSKFVSRLFLRDPAFYQNVAISEPVGSYVYRRMLAILDRYLARENFMLSLIFKGVLPAHDLPPYLQEVPAAKIRNHIGAIQSVTSELIGHLETCPPRSFSKFSLSDVPSYLKQDQFERMLRAMVRAAKPGARFCIRLFLSNQRIPEVLKKTFIREPELELKLEQIDRSFVYRFIVGTIREAS